MAENSGSRSIHSNDEGTAQLQTDENPSLTVAQQLTHPTKNLMGTTVPSARMTVAGLVKQLPWQIPEQEFFMEKPLQTIQTANTSGPKDKQQIIEQLKEIRNPVSVFEQFLPSLVFYLQNSCSNFRAGSIATKFAAWTEITNDKEILSDMSDVSIECTETPVQHWLPSQKFDDHKFNRINQEINTLVDKRVVETVEYNPQHILSSIFLTPKRDVSYRLILNLKKFNRLVVNHHFKMDSLYTITKLLVPNCFMASIDIKDAYYSVPIKASDRKLVSFKWKEQSYQFTCLPNSLSCAPRKFTKILKPVLVHLHTKGFISDAHLDNLYLQSQTYEDCIRNVIETTLLLEKLGL